MSVVAVSSRPRQEPLWLQGHQQLRHVPGDSGQLLARIEPDHGGSRPSVRHAGLTQNHGQAHVPIVCGCQPQFAFQRLKTDQEICAMNSRQIAALAHRRWSHVAITLEQEMTSAGAVQTPRIRLSLVRSLPSRPRAQGVLSCWSVPAMRDWMTAPDHDQAGFEVPELVAAELRSRGYVKAASSKAPGYKATFLALTVRHHGRSSVVFLVQVPGVIRALAQALVTWFNGSAVDERLELVARRPADSGGRFRSDSAPSVDGVASFLREGIWADDAPPGEPASDSMESVRIC
jgi:hypothetical protein